MPMMITETQGLAIRKHAIPLLRKLGVKNAEDYAAHKLDWKTLNENGKEIIKFAKAQIDTMEDRNESELRSLESCHDGLMELFDSIDREKDIRTAIGNRSPRDTPDDPDQVSRRLNMPDGVAYGVDPSLVCDGGNYGGESRWSDRKNTEVRVLSPRQSFATSNAQGPSIGDCLRAMIVGPRNDIERRTLSEGLDSAGGFTVPAPLASLFIDRLRAKSVVIAAGAKTVDMTSETLSIARLETDPTFAWRAENQEVTPSDPTFGRVLLEAKSLMGIVKISRELLEDSVNVSAALEGAFTKGMALEFDRAALYGTGTSNQPTGVALISGINSVSMGTNGAALSDYDELIDAVYEMQVDNANGPTGMICHPRTLAALAKLKDGDGNPLSVPKMIADIPRLSTTSMPINETQGTANNASSIIFGDWQEMLIGLRSSLRIEVLRERYAEYHQFAFVAHMRGDVQVAHTASFSRLKGIIP